MRAVSIVLPAKNEEVGLGKTLPLIRQLHPSAEIIVVNDGSDDNTEAVAKSVEGVICVTHPVSIGNGGAVKTGARHATGEIIVFMDADGQHDPNDISRLLEPFDRGFDLVVGARGRDSQASIFRAVANDFYNRLASLMTGFQIGDLTSGFRAVKREKFLSILYLLPNKFSYPTTSTMAFFRSGYFVNYVPIIAAERDGDSHIRLFRDGIRFMVIILKIGALFSPMRFFLPISLGLFCMATVYYLFTWFGAGRFTNMGVLLYMSSLSSFLIGVVSEQVSALHYKDTSRGPRNRLRTLESAPKSNKSYTKMALPDLYKID